MPTFGYSLVLFFFPHTFLGWQRSYWSTICYSCSTQIYFLPIHKIRQFGLWILLASFLLNPIFILFSQLGKSISLPLNFLCDRIMSLASLGCFFSWLFLVVAHIDIHEWQLCCILESLHMLLYPVFLSP